MTVADSSNIDRLAATLALEEPVTAVNQVSPARQKVLAGLGIRTVRDLLGFYPFRYVDLTQVRTIATARMGEVCTIAGEIYEMKLKRPRYNLPIVEITLVDETGTLIASCFHQQWLMKTYRAGQRVALAGKVEFNYGFSRMTNPYIEEIAPGQASVGFVLPMHHATAKLSAKMMRRIVRNALDRCRGLDDPLPLDLRTRYRLYSRQVALENIHFPASMTDAHQARRRLAYEELLMLELHLQDRRLRSLEGVQAVQHVVNGAHVAALEGALPFTLTDEQVTARDELLAVMAAPSQANHLLLGDVGTGKTAVAAFGLAAVADTGTQAFMMAPTEVLARQYGEKLGPSLDAAGISWATLTATTDSEERADILERLASGALSVLFGTQALLESDVVAPHVSLVVIDEQQRFGVEQRKALVEKGRGADVLSMTATPIPRSLALTIYGDMTLSYLHQRPRNTAGTKTTVCDWEDKGVAYDAARAALAAGQQVYVVCPLVGVPKTDGSADEGTDSEGRKGASRRSRSAGTDGFLDQGRDDEHLDPNAVSIEGDADLQGLDTHAALDHARFLQEKVFSDVKVGVLHGRLSGAEKSQIMDDFHANRIQVLVATTVIEVGVDVPNATVMIVEDADRFGLAQLHQLRGRVGRGTVPGQVFLISDSRAPVAVKRLKAMERTQDGFELSEYDLSLRREGDILGNRQHGASTLKLVNIMRDKAMIECAHADAAALLDADPDLSQPEHRALARELRILFPAHD